MLAATLSANYGVYGPPFERGEHLPRSPGSEEYLHSEKYQIRHWAPGDPEPLAPLLTRLNAIRRAHPALQTNRGLRFHGVEGDGLVCYSKRADESGDVVLVVVNTDPHRVRAGMVHLDLGQLGVAADEPYTVRDQLTGATHAWHGAVNYVELDPSAVPAHVFTLGTAEHP